MKINPSEPIRQSASPAAGPAANEAAPAFEGDRLTISQPAQTPVAPAGFSWLAAAGHWWKGFIKQPLAAFNGIKAHPWRAAGLAIAGGAAILLVPVVLPISLTTLGTVLAAGFGAWGLFNVTKGGIKAYRDDRDGKFQDAEQDFEEIGEGSFNIASTAAPYVGRQVLKMLQTETTSQVAFAERLSDGADLVGSKADTLQETAQAAHEAGQVDQAETLNTAAQQLKNYQQVLKDQATAVRAGKKSIPAARLEVQNATRAVQESAPSPELSPFHLGHQYHNQGTLDKLQGMASRRWFQIKTDKGINHRFDMIRKAFGLRRLLKILSPFIGIVPSSQPTSEAEKKN